MIDINQPCPCCSGKLYADCCKPFHEGTPPKNALQLMQSRYSAYVLNLPDYIIETTHRANPQFTENKFVWKRRISNRSETTNFDHLEILDFKEKDNFATVTFAINFTQKDESIVYTEKSVFEKVDGRWLYRSGRLEQGRALNLVTTGELRLLPLAYYGEPVLRKKGEIIEVITPEIKTLVEDMIQTMDTCDGIGLAAPQIHRSLRLFIIRVPIEKEDGYVDYGDVKVFINPKLSSPSEETWEIPEGCLSIPGIRGNVIRPKEITIEYTTLDGTLKNERVKGWEAKVIMHENDHINGVLFIDRLDPEEKIKYESFLKKLEKRLR